MSLILKGIDLPKDRDYVNLSIYSNGDVYEQAENGFYFRINADAIQIPKGHGRVIDGGELNKSVHTWNPAYTYGRSAFTRAIDNAPTILDEEKE